MTLLSACVWERGKENGSKECDGIASDEQGWQGVEAGLRVM